jgi:hypothetical protein
MKEKSRNYDKIMEELKKLNLADENLIEKIGKIYSEHSISSPAEDAKKLKQKYLEI